MTEEKKGTRNWADGIRENTQKTPRRKRRISGGKWKGRYKLLLGLSQEGSGGV